MPPFPLLRAPRAQFILTPMLWEGTDSAAGSVLQSSCEGLLRAECFLFKVIKSSDHRVGATDRQMKEKWNTNTRLDSNLWCAHQEIPFLHAAGRHAHDLSCEIFRKVHLIYSSFHRSKHTFHSQGKHKPLFFIAYFEMWLNEFFRKQPSLLRRNVFAFLLF